MNTPSAAVIVFLRLFWKEKKLRQEALKLLEHENALYNMSVHDSQTFAWERVGENIYLSNAFWDYFGKPAIEGHPEIFFNMSHCRSVAACVVSSSPVGVDVEEVREFKKSLARYVLNDEEYSMISSAPQPDREFIRLWTMKESCLKLTGEGITRDLKTVLVDTAKYHFDTQQFGSAILTVCSFKIACFSGQLTR